jgi:hypothetical protein
MSPSFALRSIGSLPVQSQEGVFLRLGHVPSHRSFSWDFRLYCGNDDQRPQEQQRYQDQY